MTTFTGVLEEASKLFSRFIDDLPFMEVTNPSPSNTTFDICELVSNEEFFPSAERISAIDITLPLRSGNT